MNNRLPADGDFFPWLWRVLGAPLSAKNKGQAKRKSLQPAVGGTASRWVTVNHAAKLTGFTEKAIRRKIERNIWLEGKHFKKLDGRLLIDMEAYAKWGKTGK